MNLSPHFTLAEFTASDTAARLGIDNDLPIHLVEVARGTAQMMERIRSHLTYLHGNPVPIVVTSAWRSPKLNAAIGSRGSSDHLKMLAVDFKAPAFGSPAKVCRALVPAVDDLGIGQLIHEFGAWVHVSSRDPDRASNRIITATARGFVTGIQEV
jgi:zinc D-Ala-D-Ala carboxypeptidase